MTSNHRERLPTPFSNAILGRTCLVKAIAAFLTLNKLVNIPSFPAATTNQTYTTVGAFPVSVTRPGKREVNAAQTVEVPFSSATAHKSGHRNTRLSYDSIAKQAASYHHRTILLCSLTFANCRTN
jgi:hypothetical protein